MGRPAYTVHDFWSKVNVQPGSCWVWQGSKTTEGYGNCSIGGVLTGAHRYAYEQEYGPIPAGLQLDHRCRTPDCVNPLHLETVTPGENTRRGAQANKTSCVHGHPYTPENTRIYRGKRHCLACSKLRESKRPYRRR